MYNSSSIETCLKGLVGFQGNYNAELERLDTDLRTSVSGVFIGQGSHPLITHDNLLSIAENFGRTNVQVFDAAVGYNKNDIVKYGVKYYYSLVDGNGITPPGAPQPSWTETNLYSAYLRRLYNSASLNLFSRIFTEKKVNEVAKTLIANVNLYEGVGNISGRITKQGRFVGYKISLKNPDTAAILDYIGLQVDTANTPFTMYLYHSSWSTPVNTFLLSHTNGMRFMWHKLATAEILSFMSDTTNAGGSWYIGYYEDDILGEAVKKDLTWSGVSGCGSCYEGVANANLYNKWSKHISLQPFYVTADNIDLVDHILWDADKEIYLSDTNWGINLQLSVMCDIGHWVCQNKIIFTDALAKQLTVDILSEMAYSMRDNQKKEKIAGLAAVALDNAENGQRGEVAKLEKAIKAVSFDFSGLSPVCLPCNTPSRMKLSTIWS